MLKSSHAWWLSCMLAVTSLTLPLATIAAPVSVLNFSEDIREWSLAAGWFYLTNSCEDGGADTDSYIQRRSVYGNSMSVLENVTSKPQCRTFRHAAADESGIYYYNRNLGRLEAIYSDRPDDPPTPLATIGDWGPLGINDGISVLRLHGSSVYWIEAELNGEFDPWNISIKRVSKFGGTVKTMISYNTASRVTYDGLGITSQYIWWTDSDGLNRIDSCSRTVCLPGNPTKEVEFPVAGFNGHIQINGSTVFWWNSNETPQRIRRTSCSFFSGNCSTSTLHDTSSATQIVGLSGTSTDAYWVEFVTFIGNRLRHKATSSGAVVATLAEGIHRSAPYVDTTGIYIQTDIDTISRVSLNAQAITREIGINAWEVTQGLQRPANDVPLVAGKTTFVRLYPTLVDGEDAGAVSAELHGSRGGQALPGSPLYPLNTSIAVFSGMSLANRQGVDGGWLFRLPQSWTRTGSGLIPQTDTTISLRAVVDPSGAYADSDDSANNEIEGDFLFTAKAPTCMTMRPVSTVDAYQPVYGFNVGQELSLAESVLPTANLIGLPKNELLREIKWCWKGPIYGPFCSTPYELIDDAEVMLVKMEWLDFWADIPAICRENNARTLYAGIVHEDAKWGGTKGIALRGFDSQVSKIPKYGQPIHWRVPLAMTMPHEIGHNYGRLHIDCGNPKNTDANYDYPLDRVDFELSANHPELHFGFDPLLQTVVNTALTGDQSIKDFMSYCDDSWYSDYTWKAIFNNTRDPIFVPPLSAQSVGGSIVRIAGIVDEGSSNGTLDYAWMLPLSETSNTQIQKLKTKRTGSHLSSVAGATFHLQLKGTGGQLLADQSIELNIIEEAGPDDPRLFELLLDAPVATVASVQLMQGNTILATLSPGTAQPAITISQPSGGASIEDEITIAWTASDADGDDLLYTILYSPNGGDEWFPLLANYGGTGSVDETVTLDLLSEAGSEGPNALVRVLASDGYNTAMATSQPFTVAKRSPFAAITHPTEGQVFAASDLIPLHGFSADPEDGLIAESQFVWSTGRTGKSTEVRGLAPGIHDIELTVTDADGLEGSNSVLFEVAPLAVPEISDSFILDGRCDDADYQQAKQLPLTPYADGTRASARIIHSASYLWLCLSGLKDTDGYVGLLLDVDNSQDATVQVGDLGFFVWQDGTPFINEGKKGSFVHAPVDNLSARIFEHGSAWTAELRIRKSAFGSFQKRVSLAIGHFEQTGNGVTRWPLSANKTSPQSWAQTNLGLIGAPTAMAPNSSVLGTGDIALTISGANFAANNRVLWNGTAVATALVDTDTLTAVVPESLVATAGTHAVSVALDGQTGLETASLPFVVSNPIPVIDVLTPSHVVMGDSGILLTLVGSGFVDGATVIWNGEFREATFISPTQLQFNLTNDDLVSATAIPVVVLNPEPDAKPSNTAMFVISVAEGVIFIDSFE